jgi:hypothetical protein
MANESTPLAPGLSTSEGKLTLVAGLTGLALETVAGLLHQLQDSGHAAPWFPAVLAVIGALMQVATLLGYVKGRNVLKATAIASDSSPKPPSA